ncbi:unnamed protein product [Amoebophrya sp. A120]|nr:unnamed protein product [Amoebophrya sp. A120]|eukprot:GSA120T00011379001.1
MRALFYWNVLRSLVWPILFAVLWSATISGTRNTLVACLCLIWVLFARAALVRSKKSYSPSSAPWAVLYRWWCDQKRHWAFVGVFSVLVMLCVDDELSTYDFFSSHPTSQQNQEVSWKIPSTLLDPASNFAYFTLWPTTVTPGSVGTDGTAAAPHYRVFPEDGIKRRKATTPSDEEDDDAVLARLWKDDPRLAAIATGNRKKTDSVLAGAAPGGDFAPAAGGTRANSATSSGLFTLWSLIVGLLYVPTLLLTLLYDVNIFFWVTLIHFLYRFLLGKQYLLRFGSKPALFSRLRTEFPAMLLVSMKIAAVGAVLSRDLWRFIPAVVLSVIFELQALSFQELGDIARCFIGLEPTIAGQQRLLSALQNGDEFEAELALVFLSQVPRVLPAWTETLFRERSILQTYFGHVRTAAIVAAKKVHTNRDYAGLHSQAFVLERGIRGMGEFVALSKTMDYKGGLINLSECVASWCDLLEVLINAIQTFPTYRSHTWDNSLELLFVLEKVAQETQLTLTQQIETYGESTVRDHWPRKHARMLAMLLGETEYPLSFFNLKRDAGKNMVNLSSLRTSSYFHSSVPVAASPLGGGAVAAQSQPPQAAQQFGSGQPLTGFGPAMSSSAPFPGPQMPMNSASAGLQNNQLQQQLYQQAGPQMNHMQPFPQQNASYQPSTPLMQRPSAFQPQAGTPWDQVKQGLRRGFNDLFGVPPSPILRGGAIPPNAGREMQMQQAQSNSLFGVSTGGVMNYAGSPGPALLPPGRQHGMPSYRDGGRGSDGQLPQQGTVRGQQYAAPFVRTTNKGTTSNSPAFQHYQEQRQGLSNLRTPVQPAVPRAADTEYRNIFGSTGAHPQATTRIDDSFILTPEQRRQQQMSVGGLRQRAAANNNAGGLFGTRTM